MTRFVSERYPELWVHPLGVRFAGGVAEVGDPTIAARLANVDGVRPAGGEALSDTGSKDEGSTPESGEKQPEEPAEPAEPAGQPRPEPPALSESKPKHVAYAVDVLGLNRAEIEAMTKVDIAERIRAARAQ